IKVFSDMGVRGFAVPSVLTAQTSDRVFSSTAVLDDTFSDQIKRLFDTYRISAVKIGLIDESHLAILLGFKEFYEIPIRVLDPIFTSSSGFEFITPFELEPLLRSSTLIMPNLS